MSRTFGAVAASLVVGSTILAFAPGCNGSGRAVPSVDRSAGRRAADGASLGKLSVSLIYISDGNGGVVAYSINSDGTLGASAPIPLTNMGILGPSVITFGPTGTLFAVGFYGIKIHIFAPAPGQFKFTDSLQPIYHSNSVVLDGRANIYASGYTTSGTQAQVYPPGSHGVVKPTVVIPGDGNSCCRVAVWAEQLYVSGNTIRVFSNPMSKPVLTRTITNATHFGGPIAVDRSSELYVASGATVLAYSPHASGNVKPDRVIQPTGSPQIVSVSGLAIVGQTLYVYGSTSGGGATIWVLDSAQGSQAPKQVLTGLGSQPLSVAVGPPTPTPSAPQEIVLYRFKGGVDGGTPYGGVIVDPVTSAVYGTTTGLQGGGGTVFKLTPAGSGYTKSDLYHFQGGSDGANPWAALVEGGDGALYSTTLVGGAGGGGTVFKLTPAGSKYVLSVLHSFPLPFGASDGANSRAQVIMDGSGALYGTTTEGGGSARCQYRGSIYGCGTAFKLTPSGSTYTEMVIYALKGGTDGAHPAAPLLQDKSGALYGTAPNGALGKGIVYKLTPSGSAYTESAIHVFVGKDGTSPQGGLIEDKSGSLYGTASGGGTTGNGVVFKLAPGPHKYVESVVYDFQGGNDGATPLGGLVADASGALYGTTTGGGTFGYGVVFKLTPSGSRYTQSVVYSFQGGNDGANPYQETLAIDKKGVLYGTTSSGGGACNCGTAFELIP